MLSRRFSCKLYFRVTQYTLTWHGIHPNTSHPNADSAAGSYVRSSLTTLIFLSEALRPSVLKSHRETCHCPRKIVNVTGRVVFAIRDIWIRCPLIGDAKVEIDSSQQSDPIVTIISNSYDPLVIDWLTLETGIGKTWKLRNQFLFFTEMQRNIIVASRKAITRLTFLLSNNDSLQPRIFSW